MPVIGVGGIMSVADAARKLDLGASLIQIYAGMLYRGLDLWVIWFADWRRVPNCHRQQALQRCALPAPCRDYQQ